MSLRACLACHFCVVSSSSRVSVAFAQLAAKRAIVNKFVNAKLSIFKRKLAPLLNLVSQ